MELSSGIKIAPGEKNNGEEEGGGFDNGKKVLHMTPAKMKSAFMCKEEGILRLV